MNICIQNPLTNEWTSLAGRSSGITPAIRNAYVKYKERPHYYQEKPCIDGHYIVYRPDNDPYLPTYITRIACIPQGIIPDITRGEGEREERDGIITISQEIHTMMRQTLPPSDKPIPILDIDDISVFIVDHPGMSRANWMPARSYQIWAYRDFMYDPHNSIKKSYMTRGTLPILYESDDRILANQIVSIDVANLSPNIIFNISRNENNSVYFERNDTVGSRVRICDNEYARAGYLGFYTRMTMDVGVVVSPPPPIATYAMSYNTSGSGTQDLLSVAHIPDPEETDDEEHQCILCFKFRVNARFSPCEHNVCCSACYSKMTRNTCPVCRQDITRVMNI